MTRHLGEGTGRERATPWPTTLVASALAVLALGAAYWAIGPYGVLAVVVVLLLPPVRRRLLPERPWRVLLLEAALGVLLVGGVVLLPDGYLPIPQGGGMLVTDHYQGRPVEARPIRTEKPPRHPYLAPNGASSMHNDAWATDAYRWPGPLGDEPDVDTGWYGVKECATLAWDRQDRLIGMCGDIRGPSMRVIDPETLRAEAELDLPDRVNPAGTMPWENLCGGAYFYLDRRDRAVVATTDRRILRVRTSDAAGEPGLRVGRRWSLRRVMPEDDCLIGLMPDWRGRIWFVTAQSRVGLLDPRTGRSRVLHLEEEITNSFAVDEEAAYVVTDHALLRFSSGDDGKPWVDWRMSYDRGSRVKPGQLGLGSGTTPTLLPGGLVAIADNARGAMNVIVYDRADGREVCRAPVFDASASATENSMIGFGSSVIVENNHGYSSPLATLGGRTTAAGIARVDVRPGRCRVRWTSEYAAPSAVPKASLATGLVYTYTKDTSLWGVDAWYLTALDARTGRLAFRVRTGTGLLMNNHYAAVTLGRDGSAYIATLAGMVRVRDRDR